MERYFYHLTSAKDWQLAQEAGVYLAPSLAEEGFIHAAGWDKLLWVANKFYQQVEDVQLLTIDSELLTSELRWEAPVHPDGRENTQEEAKLLFPHIYGTLNLDAVIQVEPMPRAEDGTFILPNRAL